MDNRRLVIAIDGPAGAGKSTIAKKIADILGIEYIDTGAMYRAFTLKVLRSNIDINNKDMILSLLESTTIVFKNRHIYLDGTSVDEEIRDNAVSNNVSNVAKIKEVREKLVEMQQQLAKSNNVVMDGRDIGTVVLPDANYKFFVTASVEERAKRRYKELIDNGTNNITYEQILEEIKQRDEIDSNREVSPLRKSPDAHVIDSTNKTIDEVVQEVISIIEGR